MTGTETYNHAIEETLSKSTSLAELKSKNSKETSNSCKITKSLTNFPKDRNAYLINLYGDRDFKATEHATSVDQLLQISSQKPSQEIRKTKDFVLDKLLAILGLYGIRINIIYQNRLANGAFIQGIQKIESLYSFLMKFVNILLHLPCNLVRAAAILPITICQNARAESPTMENDLKNGFRRGIFVMDKYLDLSLDLEKHLSNLIFAALTQQFPQILTMWGFDVTPSSKSALKTNSRELKPAKKDYTLFYKIHSGQSDQSQIQDPCTKKANELIEVLLSQCSFLL